jgi:hypothetical protein
MSPQFGALFSRLPEKIKTACHEKYHRWRREPGSLKLEPKFSVFVSLELPLGFHSIAQMDGNTIIWRWVGPYHAYTRELNRLRSQAPYLRKGLAAL